MDLHFEKLLNKDISPKILSVFNARHPDNKPTSVPTILAGAPHQSANVATGISIDLLLKRIDLVCDVCSLYSGYRSSCLPHYTAFCSQTDTELFILHALFVHSWKQRTHNQIFKCPACCFLPPSTCFCWDFFQFPHVKEIIFIFKGKFWLANFHFQYKLLQIIPLYLQTIHKKCQMSLLFIRKYKSSVFPDFVFPPSYVPQDLTLCFSRLIATHATCHPLFCYSDPCPATSVSSQCRLAWLSLSYPALTFNSAEPPRPSSSLIPPLLCVRVCLRLRWDQGRRVHKVSGGGFLNPRLCMLLYHVFFVNKQTNLIHK